jgi:hypothetical protein
MNDNTQQQNPQQAQQMAPFGGALPFSNIAKPQNPAQSQITISASPESGPIQIKTNEAQRAPDKAPESQKNTEFKPESLQAIERKEQKSIYPQNQQQQVNPAQQRPQNVVPVQQATLMAPKFYGYAVSPQLANNHPLISSQKGKGDTAKTRTWIYILLDRILKKQTYIRK